MLECWNVFLKHSNAKPPTFQHSNSMSSAFVKEEDGQWLHDIPPTMAALVNYLTRDNNGVRVYEARAYMDKKEGREVCMP